MTIACSPFKSYLPQRLFYMKTLRNIIPANIQHLITNQAEDGSWKPTWAWGRFEDVWETAKQEWSGVLTLDNLKTLRAFNAIS